MTVSRELLMRYHDGEVSEEEARAVEHALEQDPKVQDELEAYGEVGSFMRAWGEAHGASKFDISDSVLAAIDPPHARVHSLLPRIATWISLGAAIAAGSMLVIRSWSGPHVQAPVRAASSGNPAGMTAQSAPSAELPAALTEEEELKFPPATIESVDFGANPGTVFVVSTESSETPVVWLPDDGEPDDGERDRSEPL